MLNRDSDQLPDAGIVTPGGFPGGVVCMECDTEIVVGESYCSVQSTTGADVLCAGCALVPK